MSAVLLSALCLSLRLILSSSSFCAAGHPANGLISWMKCSTEEMSGSLAAVWLPGRQVKGWRQVYWTFSLSPLSKCHPGTISVGSTGGRLMWRTEGETSLPLLLDPATPETLLNAQPAWNPRSSTGRREESSLPVSEGAPGYWGVQYILGKMVNISFLL